MGKMIMRDDLEERQKWVARRHAERAANHSGYLKYPHGGLNHGRYAIYNGRIINTYYDQEFIHYVFTQQIATNLPKNGDIMLGDFGCGSGHVSRRVASQLTQPERSVVPIGIDNYDKEFWRGEKPEIEKDYKMVQGNLLDLPIKENSFHAGIFRFALPFIREKDQPELLKHIHRTLKPGAVLVILNDGVFNETEKDMPWNTFFAECVKYEGLTGLHYPSCESLIGMARDADFTVKAATDLTDIAFGYISPRICAEGLRLNSYQRRSLKKMFQKWGKNLASFRAKRKSLRFIRPMYSLVLQK